MACFVAFIFFLLAMEKNSPARVLFVSSNGSEGVESVKQWIFLLLQELERGCAIEGLIVSASDISVPMLWEFDIVIIASEATQAINSSLLLCLSELAFHRAVIIFSLQHLCYKCFTGVWPIGVQDTVMADRNLKKSAYDLLSQKPIGLDHAPETMMSLLCLLDRDDKNTLQEHALARESKDASLGQFTDVQKRRALALKSILHQSHDYRIESNACSELTLEIPPGQAESNVMGPRIMLFSLMTEIINYCNGTGSMSKGVVNIKGIS